MPSLFTTYTAVSPSFSTISGENVASDRLFRDLSGDFTVDTVIFTCGVSSRKVGVTSTYTY
ncbi:unnamed protein product [Onchocerca flexuosa]|uniref:Uncharacterized protein n=1 Tax=Onchocerca flexuosa TaxID=387005 RepID=A0A3P7XLP2_9BILA|nr:unnamed protein product [Onchocerca flexuosa]